MTRDEWLRVKAIAADALAQPAGERTAFIESRCDPDERLQREVQSLVDAAVNATNLYEAASAGVSDVLLELTDRAIGGPTEVGTRIGAYRVVSEIGRGGMGAAYLAVRADDTYEKRVAIKLIKRGMDTDAVLRRFRHERQILADLNHPNIVTLLDGGTTDDGLPYFIMEFVDGAPIDRFCEANALSTTARLKLFQDVCAAVHHAHEHHVIHRDLKPSNILVTSSGLPKLLDFGIAKLFDPEQGGQTVESTMLARAMTPQYASPEQVSGEPLTPSSDVYSLGVLLYVLVTGRHPYRIDGRTAAEAERAICEETPPRPSTVTVPGQKQAPPDRKDRRLSDLDAIVLKALRKEPKHRYGSAKELANDIQNYLDRLPVAARQYRLNSWLEVFSQRWRGTANPARRTAVMALVAFSGLMLVAAVAAILMRHPGTTASAAGAESIAVLPFANLAGNPELDFLSDGLTESLINRLSRAPHLKVIARDSVYRYKGQGTDPQQIGRELGVEAILTGTIAARGDALSVSTELVDARDRSHIWGDRYDRALGDLQSLQTELAQQIVMSLRLRFSRDEQARFDRNPTRNAEAYQSYLKGRYFWNKRTDNGLRASIDHFKQAIEKDPSFALAYAGLADAYSMLTEYHSATPRETYQEAKRAAAKALAIDEDLAEAHTSLAWIKQFYEWDFAGAEAQFRLGIDLNPNYGTGHQWYAEYLSAMGRHTEALDEIRKAEKVDPLSLIVNAVEANLLYMARRYDEAIEKCRKVIELDANFPEIYEYLKRSYDQKGSYREAIAARQTRRRLLGRDIAETAALRAAAKASSAHAYWQGRLQQEIAESRTEGVQPFEFAEILTQAGDTHGALDWLERACTDPDFMIMYMRVAPALDRIRVEPRYREVLRRGCRI